MTAEDETSRLLVVQTAFLGDVVLVSPLLRALREKFEKAHIAFLGNSGGSVMLDGLSCLDEVIVFDKRKSEKGVAGLRKKAAELKEKNFDTVICAHRSLRSAALLKLAGIPRRIGFANSAFPWVFQNRVPRDNSKHEVERNLALLGPLGGVPPGFDPKLEIPAFEPASEFISGNGDRPRIGLCPGSIWNTKRWPAPRFGKVVRSLREENEADIYLLGSEEDRAVSLEVEKEAGVEVHNLTGATSLKEWIAVMSKMDLVITNDSAPTHIASAVNVPVVVIFGPTTPRQGFAPWLNHSRTVEADLPCRPCGEHGARRCPEGHFYCMELIETDKVLGAARGLLEEG